MYPQPSLSTGTASLSQASAQVCRFPPLAAWGKVLKPREPREWSLIRPRCRESSPPFPFFSKLPPPPGRRREWPDPGGPVLGGKPGGQRSSCPLPSPARAWSLETPSLLPYQGAWTLHKALVPSSFLRDEQKRKQRIQESWDREGRKSENRERKRPSPLGTPGCEDARPAWSSLGRSAGHPQDGRGKQGLDRARGWSQSPLSHCL